MNVLDSWDKIVFVLCSVAWLVVWLYLFWMADQDDKQGEKNEKDSLHR